MNLTMMIRFFKASNLKRKIRKLTNIKAVAIDVDLIKLMMVAAVGDHAEEDLHYFKVYLNKTSAAFLVTKVFKTKG